jgi:hypothetical protein
LLFLSPAYTGDDEERTKRKRKRPTTTHPRAKPIREEFGDEASKAISIPTVAVAYDDEMNHVDWRNQLRSYICYDHRLRRGAWQALTWTFLHDVILVNIFHLQLKASQGSHQFHLQLNVFNNMEVEVTCVNSINSTRLPN